jgi:hypothetical protein
MPKPAKAADLKALSDGEIADLWGDAKAQADKADARIKPLKAEFEQRGLDQARGARWRVTKDVTQQNRFDVEAARADLGDAAAKYVKPQTRTAYQVRSLEALK